MIVCLPSKIAGWQLSHKHQIGFWNTRTKYPKLKPKLVIWSRPGGQAPVCSSDVLDGYSLWFGSSSWYRHWCCQTGIYDRMKAKLSGEAFTTKPHAGRQHGFAASSANIHPPTETPGGLHALHPGYFRPAPTIMPRSALWPRKPPKPLYSSTVGAQLVLNLLHNCKTVSLSWKLSAK